MRYRKSKKNSNRGIILLLLFFIIAAGIYLDIIPFYINTIPSIEQSTPQSNQQSIDPVVKLVFPSDRYPATAQHIQEAIASEQPSICTIDREGAEENRKQSLLNVPTKKGYDRDEWPMAMCQEGGTNADIDYITPADNRGAGSWVGNQLEAYPDGTRIQFVMP